MNWCELLSSQVLDGRHDDNCVKRFPNLFLEPPICPTFLHNNRNKNTVQHDQDEGSELASVGESERRAVTR